MYPLHIYTYDDLLFYVYSDSESAIQKLDTHLNISFADSIYSRYSNHILGYAYTGCIFFLSCIFWCVWFLCIHILLYMVL